MKNILFSIMLCTAGVATLTSSMPVYLDESRPVDERIEDALSRMTTKEKVAMLHAQSK